MKGEGRNLRGKSLPVNKKLSGERSQQPFGRFLTFRVRDNPLSLCGLREPADRPLKIFQAQRAGRRLFVLVVVIGLFVGLLFRIVDQDRAVVGAHHELAAARSDLATA